MLKTLTLLATLLAAMFTTVACGDDQDDPAIGTRTAQNGDKINDADVGFATDMIQHHAQALQMVDMTAGRDLDPQVDQLVEDIRAAQAPEIDTMAAWLTGWGEPVPETPRDHGNAHGDGTAEVDPDMPGMMSENEMADLESAEGAEFQRMWLEAMIEHHQGAIEMAQAERSEGEFKPAIDLAESIETSQQQQITLMRKLLES